MCLIGWPKSQTLRAHVDVVQQELLFIACRKEATLENTVGSLQHTLMTVSTTQAFLYLPTNVEVYIHTKICTDIYL